MENIEIKQLIEIDEDNLNKMTKWIYEWWGNSEAFTLEQVKVFLKNCMQKDTKHINLYDKFGWEYVGNIDTCIEEQRSQRLYKLKL